MSIEILVVFPNRPRAMQQLEERFTLHHYWRAEDREALVADCQDRVRGLVTSGEKGASKDLIARLPKLEIVSCYGVGVDAVHLPSCRERGIVVTNTPDVLSREVADMGILLMLSTLRRSVEADRYVRQGRWLSANFDLTVSATGKTLGILGMGRIGMEVAKRAAAMDMQIVYHNRSKRDDVDYRYAPTAVELAKASDVLLLCCPGGDATRGIVNAEILDALGPEGFLVNIARGSVVDEPALIAALQSGRIRGAGLDVFADEPNVPQALIEMDQVVLQPHAASATVETRDAMAQLTADNLISYFENGTVLTRFA